MHNDVKQQVWDVIENDLDLLNITNDDGEKLTLDTVLAQIELTSESPHIPSMLIELSLRGMRIAQDGNEILISGRAVCETLHYLEQMHGSWHRQIEGLTQNIVESVTKRAGGSGFDLADLLRTIGHSSLQDPSKAHGEA